MAVWEETRREVREVRELARPPSSAPPLPGFLSGELERTGRTGRNGKWRERAERANEEREQKMFVFNIMSIRI